MIAGLFEVLFLGVTCLVMAVGTFHTRAYHNSGPSFSSEEDIHRYQEYVRTQMWCSVVFLAGMVPAIACGIYFTWTTPGPVAYLPVVGYWIPRLIGQGAKGMENALRAAHVPNPELKERHEYISFVWKKQLIPRF